MNIPQVVIVGNKWSLSYPGQTAANALSRPSKAAAIRMGDRFMLGESDPQLIRQWLLASRGNCQELWPTELVRQMQQLERLDKIASDWGQVTA